MAAIGGLDPSVLVAPDYQTQMMQAQRRLALSQALQQQAMAETPGNGGSVSWTQGLARMVEALSAGANANAGYKQMQGANQAYARGMQALFGMGTPQTAQGAPGGGSATPTPSQPTSAPQTAPTTQQDPNSSPFVDPRIAATAQGQAVPPVAPPQAAQSQSSAPSPAPSGGAFPTLPGLSQGQSLMAYMSDPAGYWEKVSAANAPTDFIKTMKAAGIDPDSTLGHQILQGQLAKQNYIAPANARPGGWTINPDGTKTFNPQAPAPGAMPVMDANGNPTGAWTEDPSASAIQAHQAGAVAGAQAGAKAPFETINGFQNGQPVIMPKSAVTGGVLNGRYYGGNGALPSGPALGQSEAFGQYAKHSADAFAETQGIADSSPQRVQSLREMQALISGPNALNTGPTAAKVQQAAEEHGLTFLAKDNAFVFNKDAARFVAQSAQDLGLNGSDQRLGMMANASPNMKMTPQALKTVIPTMIGLEYAKMAKATAASNWAQKDPGGNAKFESTWRQSYDPRMFTAYAQGGPQALAKAPANLRQQWLNDYRNLKGMGVDFTQFAQ